MELNVTNPDAFMAHTALGITEYRSNELCDLMTAYTKEHRIVSLHASLEYIASICNTIEELTWCAFTHGCYCTKMGAGQFPNFQRKN